MAPLIVIAAVLVAVAFATAAVAWALVMLALIRRIPTPMAENRERYGAAALQKVLGKAEGDRTASSKRLPQ